MSMWDISRAPNKLTPVFGVILLWIVYFNSFLVSEALNIFLQISYLTGQVLVNKFLVLCNFFVDFVTVIYLVFQTLYEDSLIFIKDATEKFAFILSLLKVCYLFLEKGVYIGYSFGWDFLQAAVQVVKTVSSLGKLIYCMILTVKQILHFIGSFIWNFIISIPETIVNNVCGIFNFILNTINEIFNSIFLFCYKIFQCAEELHLFFLNIQLDSIYGLIIGGFFMAMVCIKFKDICLIISSALFKLYKCVKSIGISLWTGRYLENRLENDFQNPEDDERLCVVCQYHMKEIVIFPCRHLCMCLSCSSQLMKIQNTCPVCRTHIRQTLKVYV